MTGVIFDIKEMAVHDGPGIRTTAFFKGCPLRCRWCHNPEGLLPELQLTVRENACTHCGRCLRGCSHPACQPYGRCLYACPDGLVALAGECLSAGELAARLRPSADVLGDAFGGVTFSGGEPLYQPAFLLETCRKLAGIHLCMETSGFAAPPVFREAVAAMDHVIMDIKIADAKRHREYTGADNEVILQNFRTLQGSGKPYLVRTPLIPGVTDTDENLTAIRQIIGNSPWEQLPYNTLAGAKYKMLGMPYAMEVETGGDEP